MLTLRPFALFVVVDLLLQRRVVHANEKREKLGTLAGRPTKKRSEPRGPEIVSGTATTRSTCSRVMPNTSGSL